MILPSVERQDSRFGVGTSFDVAMTDGRGWRKTRAKPAEIECGSGGDGAEGRIYGRASPWLFLFACDLVLRSNGRVSTKLMGRRAGVSSHDKLDF